MPCYPRSLHCSIQPSFGNGEPILPRPLPASVVDSRISDKENNGAADLDSDEEPQKVPSIKSTLQFSYFDLTNLLIKHTMTMKHTTWINSSNFRFYLSIFRICLAFCN